MKRFLVFLIRRSWKICFFLILILIIIDTYPNPLLPSLYTSRLQPQNLSAFQFVKLRSLSLLINTCENRTTIDCLTYLHENQSDYLEPLSSSEYQYFQNEYCTNKKKMLFHTFWDNPNKLDDPLLLLHIYAHLYTQNRQCSYLIIWTLPQCFGRIDRRYNVHAPYLQFRTLMPLAKELREVGVNIHPFWNLLGGWWHPISMAIVSDAVRFIVLHKFGGMYIDADILLLRDLQPFYTHEFGYRWSILDEFNTAILRLHQNSNISSILIDLAHRDRNPWIFFPTSIQSYLHPIVLNRLPCAFFDPLWLVADGADEQATKIWKLKYNTRNTFESVFRKKSELSRQGRTVFKGAFAFHWHALHRAGQFEQGSFLSQWNQFLEAQLLKQNRL